MVAIPNITYFQYVHSNCLATMKLYQQLTEADHPNKPIEVSHPFNVVNLTPGPIDGPIPRPVTGPIQDDPGTKGKSGRGRPIVHREFAHLTPDERAKAVRAKYARERRHKLTGGPSRSIEIPPLMTVPEPADGDATVTFDAHQAFIARNEVFENAVANFTTWVAEEVAQLTALRERYFEISGRR